MNFFGINSASLNGSAVRIISGAAVFAVISSCSAIGTRTHLPDPVIIGASANFSSNAVRNVLPSAAFSVKSTCTANGDILTLVEARVSAKATFNASNTEAHFLSKSSSLSDSVVIRGANALSVCKSSLTANPTVIAGFSGVFSVLSSLTAEPGIKLSGATAWLYDGAARDSSIKAVFTASPLRTAQCYANLEAKSSLSCDSIKTHGASATFAISALVAASASTDFAVFSPKCDMRADASLTSNAVADISQSAIFCAEPNRITYASAEPISMTADFQADMRFGIQASAIFNQSSSVIADASRVKNGYLTPIVTNCVIYATAERLVMSGGTCFASSTFYAFPIINPLSLAPDNRRMAVSQDNRLMRMTGENRTMKVAL